MSDLQRFTSAELLALRQHVTSAAVKFYMQAEDFTRRQTALPELTTPELVQQWRDLRIAHLVAIAAGQEQFELLEDIMHEFARRAREAGQPLESMTPDQAIRYIQSGRADA